MFFIIINFTPYSWCYVNYRIWLSCFQLSFWGWVSRKLGAWKTQQARRGNPGCQRANSPPGDILVNSSQIVRGSSYSPSSQISFSRVLVVHKCINVRDYLCLYPHIIVVYYYTHLHIFSCHDRTFLSCEQKLS